MRVKILKDKRVGEAHCTHLRKIGEEKDFVVYECDGEIWISPGSLSLKNKDFLRFYRKIKVDGGIKRLVNDQIYIGPVRHRVLTVRLSDGEYALLKSLFQEPVSKEIRSIIIYEIRGYFAYRQMQRERSNELQHV